MLSTSPRRVAVVVHPTRPVDEALRALGRWAGRQGASTWRAVERVWELSAPASIADIDSIGDRFRPWRTLAVLYL
jgi:hypothetical protein